MKCCRTALMLACLLAWTGCDRPVTSPEITPTTPGREADHRDRSHDHDHDHDHDKKHDHDEKDEKKAAEPEKDEDEKE